MSYVTPAAKRLGWNAPTVRSSSSQLSDSRELSIYGSELAGKLVLQAMPSAVAQKLSASPKHAGHPGSRLSALNNLKSCSYTSSPKFDAPSTPADRVEAELGPIDVWVNNAMTAVLAEVRNTEPEEFRRVMEVTYLGSVHGTLAALRHMGPRDRGTIVQVGSALARRGIPLQATYCAAKHGIQGFAESLRTELRHQGSSVRTSLVQLPGINTTQFGWVRLRGIDHHPQPVAPIYQPEVAADAILAMADRPRRELWVGVPTYYTIVGSWLAPWLQDWFLARTNYEGQESDRPVAPDRQDYLFAPVDDDEDRGAHGIFSEEAKTSSPALWATLHRRELLAGLGAGAGALAAAAAARARAR